MTSEQTNITMCVYRTYAVSHTDTHTSIDATLGQITQKKIHSEITSIIMISFQFRRTVNPHSRQRFRYTQQFVYKPIFFFCYQLEFRRQCIIIVVIRSAVLPIFVSIITTKYTLNTPMSGTLCDAKFRFHS